MNQVLLQRKIGKIPKQLIAHKLNMKYSVFIRKLTGRTEFTAWEIHKLQRILRLTNGEVRDIWYD